MVWTTTEVIAIVSIISGIIGVLASSITSILLKNREFKGLKQVDLFKSKMNAYSEFMRYTSLCLEKETLTQEETDKLTLLTNEIYLLAHPRCIKSISRFTVTYSVYRESRDFKRYAENYLEEMRNYQNDLYKALRSDLHHL